MGLSRRQEGSQPQLVCGCFGSAVDGGAGLLRSRVRHFPKCRKAPCAPDLARQCGDEAVENDVLSDFSVCIEHSTLYNLT